MIQAFKISQEQLANIDYICPADKNYNLYLNKGQHWELSKSGKIIYLINEKPFHSLRFIVSKTIFVLKKEEF